jgi:hypothetical protein
MGTRLGDTAAIASTFTLAFAARIQVTYVAALTVPSAPGETAMSMRRGRSCCRGPAAEPLIFAAGKRAGTSRASPFRAGDSAETKAVQGGSQDKVRPPPRAG